MRITIFIFLVLFLSGYGQQQANSRVISGIVISESLLTQKNDADLARQDAQNPLLTHKYYISDIERGHHFNSKHIGFAFLLSMVAFLGFFRQGNQSYFRNIFRAFRNAGLNSRQLRDQLQQNSVAALLMNVFACCSIALYLYQVLVYFNRLPHTSENPMLSIIGLLALGLALVYLARFAFLKIAGWLFQAPDAMDNYSFQIFLINKILGIFLLPFTVILAFGQGGWVQVSLFLSFVLIAILFLYRYFRSGTTFRYFIMFSRFHFFLYLCASELLPLAIIIKLISSRLAV